MDELVMQKPAGMRRKTAEKVERYLSYLYMHGAMTGEQIWALAGNGEKVKEVNRVMKMSGYVTGKNRSVRLYKDGAWRKMNRLMVWQLTPEGVHIVERDLYDRSDKWAYSSGKIFRDVTARRIGRILRVAQFYVEVVRKAAATDMSYWDVAQMLSVLGIREACENDVKASVTNLWRHRPSLAGIVGIGDEHIVAVSLYDAETLNGLGQYLNRAFPLELSELTNYGVSSIRPLLLLTEGLYERFLPVLTKWMSRHFNLMVLPYEFSMDHAVYTAWLLRGKRGYALRPLIERYERDGWCVERTEDVPDLAKEQYSYRAVRGGEVEFFDSTFGAELMHLYSLLNYERPTTSTQHAPGARVLYVTSERERDGILAYLRKQNMGKFGTFTEFRLLEL